MVYNNNIYMCLCTTEAIQVNFNLVQVPHRRTHVVISFEEINFFFASLRIYLLIIVIITYVQCTYMRYLNDGFDSMKID